MQGIMYKFYIVFDGGLWNSFDNIAKFYVETYSS